MDIKDKALLLDSSFELLMCPHCGARLNRVENLLPTSCEICCRHRIKCYVKHVVEVKNIIGDKNAY